MKYIQINTATIGAQSYELAENTNAGLYLYAATAGGE